MTKNIFRVSILSLLVFTLLFPAGAAHADSLHEDPPPAGLPKLENASYRVNFSKMGSKQAIFMQGPLTTSSLKFSLPAEWQLNPGAVLHIDLSAFISNFMVGQEIPNLEEVNTGWLKASLNGTVIGVELLQGSGQHEMNLPIPGSVLKTDPADGLNELILEWDATSSCDQNIAASIAINPTSYLYLPHTVSAPALRLDAYPWPFSVPGNPDAHPVALVVPDNASLPVLQGAIQVATSLGRIAGVGLDFSVVPAGRLTQEKYADYNLILLGDRGAFELSKSHALPPPPAAEDGILSLYESPWNAQRVVLLVTGASDDAIFKAASALSSGQVVTAATDDIAFVSSAFTPGQPVFNQDQLFADLGIGALHFQSFGASTQEVLFNIPSGKSIGADAYLDLVFNHSQLIDYLRSGIQVRVNGISIGSIRLSDSSSNLNTVRFILPASAIKNGTNHLEIQVDITPRSACSDSRQGNLFITIFPESFLHLPVTDSPLVNTTAFGLGAFPASFTNQELDHTTFVLPPDDPASWASAGLLAYALGANDAGSLFPRVELAAAGQPASYADGNHIVIGQPGRATAIADLEAVLPIPFDASGNLTVEAQSSLAYKIDATRSTGFLELAPAPDAPGLLVLLVAGNNDQGLAWASQVLVSGQKRSLGGDNFAVVQSSTSVKSDSIHPASEVAETAPAIPGAPGSAGGTGTSGGQLPPRQDAWALPVLVLAALALLALIIAEIAAGRKVK